MKLQRIGNTLLLLLPLSSVVCAEAAVEATTPKPKYNVIYFLADNLGMGELSGYSGGPLRGATTTHLDDFANQGMKLLNFAPESQCTPSRSALMTGRYSIRSGNQRGPSKLRDVASGLVSWERTIADVFSDGGYRTFIVGKWHIGNADGRWPTDHGFDEWYGITDSYGESTWPSDPYYRGKVAVQADKDNASGLTAPLIDPSLHTEDGERDLQSCAPYQTVSLAEDSRDPVVTVMHSVRTPLPGGSYKVESASLCMLDQSVRRDIDRVYLDKAKAFIEQGLSGPDKKPFFLYFNHSMMHMPNIPRLRYSGSTGRGDWADSLAQLDGDFGELMAFLEKRGLRENTIVVFSGDNGPEDYELWRGDAGHWAGSYFTGMEGSLRTPAMIRFPHKVAEGQVSNEIVHITDMFTTLIRWVGLEVPNDRVIDGRDQRHFFEGAQSCSNRVSFPYWLGDTLYGIKWHDFKAVNVLQRHLSDPALVLPTPNIVNLDSDPKETRPFDLPYLHTWVAEHAQETLVDYQQSVLCESLIKPNAALDTLPQYASDSCAQRFSPAAAPALLSREACAAQ